MTLYSLVLFVHVGAALTLASALTIDGLTLRQLRASAPTAAQSWLNIWSTVPRIASISGLLLLFSGGYLTERMSAWTLAWPKAALAALILIGILGAIAGRRTSALRGLRAIGQGGQAEYVKRLQDPMLTISLCTRIALLLAAVLLMNAKPELWESLGIVGGAVVLGLSVAWIFPSKESRLRMPAADSGGLR